jgi:hypothetical protein
VLADALSRLAKKEANEARRAAKKPSAFLAWVDGFYDKFEATLALALSPIVDADRAKALAAAYCGQSRDELLDLAGEATAQSLPALVETKLAEWSLRPDAIAAEQFPDGLGSRGQTINVNIANAPPAVSIAPAQVLVESPVTVNLPKVETIVKAGPIASIKRLDSKE